MGLPVRSQTFTAAFNIPGPQEALNLEYIDFSCATIAVAILEGDATYSVEFTLDDINDPAATVVWFTMEDFPVGSSETLYTAIYYPFQFIRINIEALTGTVAFKVAQSQTPLA